jgi:hypothetical protein
MPLPDGGDMKDVAIVFAVLAYASLVLYGTFQATVVHGWSPWWWAIVIPLIGCTHIRWKS